jgi:hypothetical protein
MLTLTSLSSSRVRKGLLALTLTMLSTASFAVNGREAVGACIDSTATGARCGWAVSTDGSIDVCDKSGCVTCPSATSECVPAKRNPKRPLKFTATAGDRLLNSPR